MSKGIKIVTKSIKKLTKKSRNVICKLDIQKCRKSKDVFESNQEKTETFKSNFSQNFDSFDDDSSFDSEFLKEIEMLDLILKQNE